MKDCLFCKIAKKEVKSFKVFENDDVYAFYDINPISKYHTLVIPKKHYENLYDIPEKEFLAVMKVVRELVLLYKKKLGIKNVQLLSNSGKEAQQEVPHLHFHIIPRKDGDEQNIKFKTYPDLVKEYC
jgi:histidine triad (HIT) family protein